MTEMWAFFDQHVILAWCALWLIWGVFWVIAVAIRTAWVLSNRILRTFVVLFRGWPPSHLDADGDWKQLPEKK